MTPGARFAVATGVLMTAVVGGVALISRSSGRLRGSKLQRGEIATAADLQRRLDVIRRDIKKAIAAGGDSRERNERFGKLRDRVWKLTSSSQGFFPEAVDMTEAVDREIAAGREAAAEVYAKQLDEQRIRAHDDYREEQHARPDYFMLKDKHWKGGRR